MSLNKNNPKVVCFIQINHTDLQQTNKEKEFILKLKDSKLFDYVVLAAPNIPDNIKIKNLSIEMNVDYHLGNIDNIVERIDEVLEKFDTEIIVRILINWFYVDLELVEKMINYTKKSLNLDYLCLPHNFDVKFGCDIITKRGIEKIKNIFSQNNLIKNEFQFRPWYLLESHHDFDSIIFEDVPNYTNEVFYKLRKDILNSNAPVAWDFGETFSHHEYENAKKYVDKNTIALDISCGWGHGTSTLAKYCKKVIGFDVEKKFIDYAKTKIGPKFPNIEFMLGDNISGLENESIDFAISAHTMEHVENEDEFLKEIKRVLKINGILIIEVPLRIKKPFSGNNEPLLPHTELFAGHFREYSIESFKQLVTKNFKILEIFGANRGSYCKVDKARNAVMAVLKK